MDPNRLILRLCAAVQSESGAGEGGLVEEGERLRQREEGGDGERWQEVESDTEQSSCDIRLCALSLAVGVSFGYFCLNPVFSDISLSFPSLPPPRLQLTFEKNKKTSLLDLRENLSYIEILL